LGITCLLIFLRQETSNVGTAHWASALNHSTAFGIDFNLAAFDLPLAATLDTITFEIHRKTSSGKVWFERNSCRVAGLQRRQVHAL
jgi:hypothetical protein